MARLSGYKYNRFSIAEPEFLIQKEKLKMSAIEKLIAAGNWGGFFDALDVNRDGTLSHQEFWKCEKIGSSDALMDALDKFDVSFNFFGPLEKMKFQKTDKDNDHKISLAEFIQHMKLTRCIAAGQ